MVDGAAVVDGAAAVDVVVVAGADVDVEVGSTVVVVPPKSEPQAATTSAMVAISVVFAVLMLM